VAIAQAATDSGWSLISSYGPIWGGGLLLFALAGSLLRANESKHWIAQGRTLALLTGLVSVLGSVAQWHFNGASSAGIIATLVAAVSLVMHPVPSAAAVARSPQAGKTTYGTVLTMALVAIAVAACLAGSTARQTAAAGVVSALDCEAAHLDAQALSDARSFADAKVQGWISGHVPGDVAALQAKIEADLAPIKSDLGHCAITGALAAATTVVTSGTAVQGLSSSTAPPGPDPVQVRAAFSAAARVIGWAPVKVAGGTVL